MCGHWKQRWMKFTHQNQRIQLTGVLDEQQDCRAFSAAKLHGLLKRATIVDCVQVQPIHQEPGLSKLTTEPMVETTPVEVQQILQEFDELFGEPQQLPPEQDCDHHVPLISGAQSVNVRPYRYAPHQKSEIERQV